MYLQPLAQSALLAAYAAQGHRLHKTRGGFACIPAQVTTSSKIDARVFTIRPIRWLEEAYLVTLDDPQFPKVVTLNARGIAHARELVAHNNSLEKVS
ncbi:hypothetical protein ACIPR8_06935 [Stenotrophomonas sp. LARHCG68]